MPKSQEHLPSSEEIRDYKLLKEMLEAQREEFDLLSKKKHDGQLNAMKIKMVNRALEPLNKILRNEPSHKFLDVLKEDEMPTNSDVVLIISQYETAIGEFRNKYYSSDKYLPKGSFGSPIRRWLTKERPSDYYSQHIDDNNYDAVDI